MIPCYTESLCSQGPLGMTHHGTGGCPPLSILSPTQKRRRRKGNPVVAELIKCILKHLFLFYHDVIIAP